MPKALEPTLLWENAPDILTPRHLGKLLGVSTKKANEIFNSRDFPLLSESITKKGAYKYQVAKFLGIQLHEVNNEEDTLTVLKEILDVLNRKINYREGIR